ncbi:hypothetical protein [Comamonas thiooxydans]|uniref:hypothetical protein n=1 Tax=Comamonas thiooxydans TaxID=363952 RepID=UPI0021141D3F|nr:hypothetical protein [Comamonas thiooxydans]UUE95338.1 hypothetical protein MJ608_06780 [Comamonas thiooxydans]
MLILADSDVVRKLAFCELLLELHQIMVVPPDQMRVLPALRFQVAAKLAAYPSALAHFQQFLKKVYVAPAANPEWAEFFSELDVGEQQLFSVLCQGDAQEIITGDKRCLETLSGICTTHDGLKPILDSKKVWCFEAIILRLLNNRGFSIVNARMQRWRGLQNCQIDAVIDRAFPLANGSIGHATSVLQNYLSQLRARAPLVLLSV